MYGRGNFAPQFGQGLQRPMPPYHQLAVHPSAPHLQPGNSVSIIQQGGLPHGGPAFLHPPPITPNMPHQGPPVSTSNTSQPYLHPPPPPYIGAHQNFVSGSQNSQPPPPPPPSIGLRAPPPPPPFMQLPPPPPPPPPTAAGFFPSANFQSNNQQSAETYTLAASPQLPPLPTSSPPMAPPPPSSGSQTQSGCDPVLEQALVSGSRGNIGTHSHKSGETPISDEDMSLKQSGVVSLPPPPPKPTDENIVRNIEVLCQFIAKNGPEFEEMARKNESKNPDFNFLVGGDPGSEAASAHEYFLWMKKKCTIGNDLHKDQGQGDLSQRDADVDPSSGPNALSNVGSAHSPADSDVDMEDDITQSDKDHGAYNSIEDVEPEPILVSDVGEMLKQINENELQDLKDNSPALNSSQSVNLHARAESKPENPAGQQINVHSSFRLIQNYASDDSSVEEQCHENVKTIVVSPLGKSGASSSHDVTENFNKESDIGLSQSITTCLVSGLTKDRDDVQAIQGDLLDVPNNASQGKHEIDDLEGKIERFNANAAFHGKYASGSSGVDSEKEDKKNTSSAVKVDEFGRLVKEGATESETDESQHLRRRGRRDRSRSHSRSPSDRRRRRRSPRRRKERRSRSRSWSPKRRRSRSRSPYRPAGDFRGDTLRRGKVQTRECFDFLKGRCYRGASCRYSHHEPDKDENTRLYNSKQHHEADKHDSRNLVSQKCDERSIAETIDDAARTSVSHEDVEKLASDVKACVDSGKEDQVPGASDEPISHLPICEKQTSSGVPSTNEQVIIHLQAEGSVIAYHKVDEDLLKKDKSSKFDSSAIQASTIPPSGLSANELSVDKISNESSAPNASASDFSHQVSHLPPPPLPQQATNAPQNPNLLVDYNYMAPSGSLPPQSVPVTPLPNQHSHYPVPPNPAWSILPQPRPPHMAVPSVPGNSLQFQHVNFPLRNDFPGQISLRAPPGELPGHSQVGGFSHQMYHLPSSNIALQPFTGSDLARDDRYPQFPPQSIAPYNSFVPGVSPQPVPFQGDSTVKSTQSFPGNNVLVGESSKPSFQNHLFVQQRLPPYGPQLTASESMPNHGGSLSVPGYSSNLDRDTSSSFFDVGGTRISTHYNPYASTFDQPLSTRFSSIGVGPAPNDGRLSGDLSSGQIISSLNSSKAGGQAVLKSGGDQYDPLFDSIDPKHAKKLDHAADNSEIMLKLSNHHNMEENNKQKMVGAVAANESPENDEFGETADAEVGAVENGSPSDPNEDADMAEGDIEIDQVKPEGRSKKSKDSRSMKLFKVAVANFVKDVLKPQWRQGNMSKEVFKTIVKKTVDKVSDAMKNHRLPKSQAKIDHYIDSSRRKLMQLVEGYVSKYKS